jgi:UDP:flavonoid glycosyltransferase YjiC (YdhE family)
MKICILTIGTRGDIQPYIALGLGLKTSGHEVTIATLGEFEALVVKHGLHHAKLRGDFLKVAQSAQGEPSKQRPNPLKLIRQYTEMAKDTLEDEWESAKDAELFIYNPAAIGAFDIAEKLGVPTFAAFPAPLYSPTKEFPSPFFPFRNLGPFNKLSHKFFAKLAPAIYRSSINEWRRDVLGLPPTKSGEMLRGKPVTKLYAYSEVVVPRPSDWDESSVVTGYWFLDTPGEWQPEPALVKFLRDGPPPVYVGFGSMSILGGANKIPIVLEALELAGQRGVLADGDEGRSPAMLSENVLRINAVPHDWLFPQMAVVVHHGGAGTTGASLRAGKPAVICPFVGDQTFWGYRVAALGAGPSPIPKGKLTAESLAAAIKRAVTDEGMRQRAVSLRQNICEEDGVGRAVALINR